MLKKVFGVPGSEHNIAYQQHLHSEIDHAVSLRKMLLHGPNTIKTSK